MSLTASEMNPSSDDAAKAYLQMFHRLSEKEQQAVKEKLCPPVKSAQAYNLRVATYSVPVDWALLPAPVYTTLLALDKGTAVLQESMVAKAQAALKITADRLKAEAEEDGDTEDLVDLPKALENSLNCLRGDALKKDWNFFLKAHGIRYRPLTDERAMCKAGEISVPLADHRGYYLKDIPIEASGTSMDNYFHFGTNKVKGEWGPSRAQVRPATLVEATAYVYANYLATPSEDK